MKLNLFNKNNVKIHIRDLMFNTIASSKNIPKRVRMLIYKWGDMEIKGSIFPGSFMGGSKIKIGKDSFVNYNCFFDGMAPIKIGDNCFISMEVMFCTSMHEMINVDNENKISDSFGLPINVEDNCWIGARATILPGVNIGIGCIIAAGAVVNRNCAPNGLYAGVPTKRVKELTKSPTKLKMDEMFQKELTVGAE